MVTPHDDRERRVIDKVRAKKTHGVDSLSTEPRILAGTPDVVRLRCQKLRVKSIKGRGNNA
jgi:hypothetical protein